MNTRNCEHCNIEFTLTSKGHNKLYCSKKCKLSAFNKRAKENPIKRKRDSNHSSQVYKCQRDRAILRKIEFIKLKGGECELCGYNKNIASLCFHHLDPNQKEFGIDARKMSNTNMEDLLKEVNKCQLLCHNCHQEIHNPSLNNLLE